MNMVSDEKFEEVWWKMTYLKFTKMNFFSLLINPGNMESDICKKERESGVDSCFQFNESERSA